VSELASTAVALALSLVLCWAAVSKISAPDRWRRDLLFYFLPRPLRLASFLCVPWLELTCGVLFLTGPGRLAAAGALFLFTAFSGAILHVRLKQGTDLVGCACFGDSTARDYRVLLLRNGALLALAASVLASGGRAALPGFLDASTPGRGQAFAVGLVALAGTVWCAWQLRGFARRSAERSASRTTSQLSDGAPSTATPGAPPRGT
jgi:hypothetical protein